MILNFVVKFFLVHLISVMERRAEVRSTSFLTVNGSVQKDETRTKKRHNSLTDFQYSVCEKQILSFSRPVCCESLAWLVLQGLTEELANFLT